MSSHELPASYLDGEDDHAVLRAGRMGSGQVKALQSLGPQFVLPYQAQVLDSASALMLPGLPSLPRSLLLVSVQYTSPA